MGAIETIEQAIHLVRHAGLRSLVLAWTGAVPFAVGLLIFWRDMRRYGNNGELCALESLVLVALLVWMNVWRGVFAADLQARLCEGEFAGGIATGRRSVGAHLVLGSFKLVVLPLATLAVLPLPGTVALFRVASLVASVEKSDILTTFAKARKLTRSIGQPVLLTLLLGFVGTLLFVNVAVTLFLAPHVALVLTGYESPFTRAGMRILAEPSFYIVAGLITWLAIEPLTQAVYTVAAFHAGSNETGEDVRVRFRSLMRASAPAALLVLALVAHPTRAAIPIDPSQLDRSIRETLTSPDYGWRDQSNETTEHDNWFIRMSESIAHRLSSAIESIGRGVRALLRWIRDLFQPTVETERQSSSSGQIRRELYLLIGLVVLAMGVLVWRNRQAFRRTAATVARPEKVISLTADDITADQLPEERWLSLADECLHSGQFRLGLRALQLATLAWLAEERWITVHPGKTDHEYEAELKRRARAFPNAGSQFASNIGVFERVWYGSHEISFDACQVFRNRTEQMKREMAGTRGALR